VRLPNKRGVFWFKNQVYRQATNDADQTLAHSPARNNASAAWIADEGVWNALFLLFENHINWYFLDFQR